jgi:hypothetical protein
MAELSGFARNLIALFLVGFVAHADAGAECLTCPRTETPPALKFRLAAGLADRHASWPRAGAVSGAGTLTAERSHGLIESQNVQLSMRPARWSASSAAARGSLASASVSMRHMIVTDHMAESWFLMPWIELGIGMAREGPAGAGPFARGGHRQDLARFAVGLDVWPARHWGFFTAWDAATRSARPFEIDHYLTDHGLEMGLILVTADGGYSR